MPVVEKIVYESIVSELMLFIRASKYFKLYLTDLNPHSEHEFESF